MATEVKAPVLPESVADGTIATWHKKVGDAVKRDENHRSAPAAGRVSFAGDYRGYGKIVIIDHGGGWTSLITGMIALSVSVGDTLDAGAPVGRAGSDDSRITVELRRAGRPVDLVAMLG